MLMQLFTGALFGLQLMPSRKGVRVLRPLRLRFFDHEMVIGEDDDEQEKKWLIRILSYRPLSLLLNLKSIDCLQDYLQQHDFDNNSESAVQPGLNCSGHLRSDSQNAYYRTYIWPHLRCLFWTSRNCGRFCQSHWISTLWTCDRDGNFHANSLCGYSIYVSIA